MLAAAASSTARRLASSLGRRGSSEADLLGVAGVAARALSAAAADTDIMAVMAQKVPVQQVWWRRGEGAPCPGAPGAGRPP